MPRTKPTYNWGFTSAPLEGSAKKKEEQGTVSFHRVTSKSGKGFKTDSIPMSLPTKDGAFIKDVSYGSHKEIDKLIGEEMRRLNL